MVNKKSKSFEKEKAKPKSSLFLFTCYKQRLTYEYKICPLFFI
jgi:hypothetical protein